MKVSETGRRQRLVLPSERASFPIPTHTTCAVQITARHTLVTTIIQMFRILCRSEIDDCN